MAELADAPDLGSGALRRGGSSPFSRTNFIAPLKVLFFLPKIRCLKGTQLTINIAVMAFLLVYIKWSRSLTARLYVIINELELFN